MSLSLLGQSSSDTTSTQCLGQQQQTGRHELPKTGLNCKCIPDGRKKDEYHECGKNKKSVGFIKITTIWKSLQKVGNQYQPSTTTGQDPVSSGPPWTKACKSLTPIVRGYQVQAPSRSPRNTVKTPKNWIFWKFIMDKEKSRNGPPNLYFHGEMAIW